MPRITTSDGVDLAVYDFGGDGAPLLLAHATGFHGRCWLPVVEHLRARFHCYAFDERAHGDSSTPPDGNFAWERFGTDVLAVVDWFGLERPFGVGHSCGGAALLLAEQARPGTFRGLYLYEPVVHARESEEPPPLELTSQNPLAIGARRRREFFDSYDAALANFRSKPPMSRFAPDALEAYVYFGFAPVVEGSAGPEAPDRPDPRAGSAWPDGPDPRAWTGPVRLKCRGDDEAQTYAEAPRHDAYHRLPDVHCPTTLVSGEHTDAFPDSHQRTLAPRLPSATVEVAAGLTHFGPLEDPAAVAAAITRAFSPA